MSRSRLDLEAERIGLGQEGLVSIHVGQAWMHWCPRRDGTFQQIPSWVPWCPRWDNLGVTESYFCVLRRKCDTENSVARKLVKKTHFYVCANFRYVTAKRIYRKKCESSRLGAPSSKPWEYPVKEKVWGLQS
jgi:hypothetical protein